MAGRTRTRAKAAPEPEPEPEVEETENGSAGLRPVGALHEHMANWLNEEYGEELDGDLTARMVQVVISKRNEYRRSDEYAEFKDEQDKARATAEEEKASRPKRSRKDAEEEAEEEAEEAPKPARARRGRAKAAETEETEAPAPKARTRRRAATPATEEAEKPAPARRSRRRAAASSEAEPF